MAKKKRVVKKGVVKKGMSKASMIRQYLEDNPGANAAKVASSLGKWCVTEANVHYVKSYDAKKAGGTPFVPLRCKGDKVTSGGKTKKPGVLVAVPGADYNGCSRCEFWQGIAMQALSELMKK